MPVVTWKAGFRVVRSLVGHYHLGVEGVDKATAAEILVDVMALIQGFVEHFPHAVDAILPYVAPSSSSLSLHSAIL